MNTATHQLLIWELRWIPVELALTGLGLYLLLGLQLPEAGALFLFVALVISGLVRFSHYRNIGRQQADNAA